MNLEEFSKLAGVEVTTCDPEWGGSYGYKTLDSPDCVFCGFKTKKDALTNWVLDTFGINCGKALLELLKKGKT